MGQSQIQTYRHQDPILLDVHQPFQNLDAHLFKDSCLDHRMEPLGVLHHHYLENH
jgi:hypothetical protein